MRRRSGPPRQQHEDADERRGEVAAPAERAEADLAGTHDLAVDLHRPGALARDRALDRRALLRRGVLERVA